MKWTSAPLNVLLVTFAMGIASTPQVSAQQLPPPPPAAPLAQPVYSRQGTIKALNSGPNGETNGFILSDGTVILFPAAMGDQFRSTVREGSRISVAGQRRTGVSGRTLVDAQTITAHGQTFSVPVLPLPPNGPPSPGGPGRGPRPGPALPPAGGPPPPPPGRGPAPPDSL